MLSTSRSPIEWFYLIILVLVVIISVYLLHTAYKFVTESVTFKKLYKIVQTLVGEDEADSRTDIDFDQSARIHSVHMMGHDSKHVRTDIEAPGRRPVIFMSFGHPRRCSTHIWISKGYQIYSMLD